VVLPDKDDFQGYYIRDNDTTKATATQLLGVSLAMQAAAKMESLGAVQAVLVEGAYLGRSDLIAGAALVLAEATKIRYFAIVAHRDAGGTRTEMLPLDATNVVTARWEFDRLPIVEQIKQRIADKAPPRKN
jgi:hypothetical protein